MTLPLSRRGALALPAVFLARPTAAAVRDTVNVRIARDIANLDPANRTSAIESNINKACMSRLIRSRRGSFATELDAATLLEQAGPTALRFELKPGLVFSHGYGPLTSEDVRFSYERYATAGPGGGIATRGKDWAALDRVEVTGPLSGVIHLKAPAPNLLTDVMPGGSGCIVSRRAYEELGPQMSRRVVGSGPYTFESWEPNSRVVLRANPDYVGDRPAFERIVLRPIEDAKTAQLALRAGEVDFTALDPAAIRETEAAGLKVIQLDSINYVWIGANIQAPLLSDHRVRKAIRLAIDPAAVVAAAYNGRAKTIKSLIAPGQLGAWPEAPSYPRDTVRAKALLAEAGVKPGTPVTLTVLATPTYQAVALVARAMLAEVGLELQVDARPAGTYWSSGKDTGLELSVQRFGGQPDPAFQTQWFVSSQIGAWNWQRWSNPEFDRLDAAARSTDDTAARARDYVQMQKLMDESAAFIWLTNEVNAYGAAPWLDPAIQPTGDDLQFPMFRAA